MLTRTRWPYPRVVAHRAGGSVAPENTLVALRAAAGLGFAGVEIDARLAACGSAVLMHDSTVDRTTDASGPVAEFTADDLRGLDAGVWFGNEYAGEHVPALDAAAVLCHATGLWTNIEIKADDGEDAEAGHVIAREVKRLWPDASPSPLLSSFSEEALAAAMEAVPDLPRALIVRQPPNDWREPVTRLKCRALHVDQQYVTEALIADVHAAGIAIAAYTVNSPGRALVLFEWGVDAVFTDELRDIRADFLATHDIASPAVSAPTEADQD